VKPIDGVPGGWFFENLMTPVECETIISESEKLGFKQKKSKRSGPAIRNNMRAIYEASDKLTNLLEKRLRPHLSKVDVSPIGPNWHLPLEGQFLNNKWRVNSYKEGEAFLPHFDTGHVFTASKRSILSLIIYLNDDFEGGETTFFPDSIETPPVSVRPKAGSAIIFHHYGPLNPLHSTEPVTVTGRKKYIARTDIIFEDHNYQLKNLLFAVPAEVQKAVLLLGVPGAGKSSQLTHFSKTYGWPTLNFGQCVRILKQENSPLAKKLADFRESQSKNSLNNSNKKQTKWLSDDISNEIFRHNLPKISSETLILDGYPRKRSQSVQLETSRWLFIAAVYLKISKDEQMARIAARKKYDRPTEDIEARMIDWEQDTFPLVEHYKKRGELVEIDGTQPEEDIAKSIERMIEEKLFDLIYSFIPASSKTFLDDFEPTKINLSKKYKVYRFSKDLDEVYLKVVYEPASRNPSSYEGPILALVKEEGFPFATPVVRASFNMGPEVNGVISERVPGITVKEIFKKKLVTTREIINEWSSALATIHTFKPKFAGKFLSRTIPELVSVAQQRLASNMIRPSSFSAKYGLKKDIDLGQELKDIERGISTFKFEQIYLNHGDPCAPNFIWSVDQNRITGCVDLSGIGFTDIHWDLSIACWSLNYNAGIDCAEEFQKTYVKHITSKGHKVDISQQKIDLMYRLARFLL
jgi:adenylate kinase family enzyme/aminoglycoside phosphotransferase